MCEFVASNCNDIVELLNCVSLSSAFMAILCNGGKNVYSGLDVKYTTFLSCVTHIWLFSTAFRKNHKYQIPLISVQWERGGFVRADGRTDGDRNDDYANGPKDWDIKGSVRVVPCSGGNWDGNRDS